MEFPRGSRGEKLLYNPIPSIDVVLLLYNPIEVET